MLLQNSFYSIDNTQQEGDATIYSVTLLADCPVYDGHFPGRPISPGVCNIGMIQELARLATGDKFSHFTKIKQCRLTAVAAPNICDKLLVKVSTTPADDHCDVSATIASQTDGQLFMDLRGTLG